MNRRVQARYQQDERTHRMSGMAQSERNGPRIGIALASLWRSLKRDLFGSYRPELHYMRGPGPKWRAKHGGRSQAVGMTALVDAPF